MKAFGSGFDMFLGWRVKLPQALLNYKVEEKRPKGRLNVRWLDGGKSLSVLETLASRKPKPSVWIVKGSVNL